MPASHAETLQTIYICIAAWVGLCIGSFLNVVVYRLPIMIEHRRQEANAKRTGITVAPGEPFNLSVPRSRCPSCGHQIRWFENIPVLSYIALGGRCSACKSHISLRYPVIEAVTGMQFSYCIWKFGVNATGMVCCIAGATLLTLASIHKDRYAIKSSNNSRIQLSRSAFHRGEKRVILRNSKRVIAWINQMTKKWRISKF